MPSALHWHHPIWSFCLLLSELKCDMCIVWFDYIRFAQLHQPNKGDHVIQLFAANQQKCPNRCQLFFAKPTCFFLPMWLNEGTLWNGTCLQGPPPGWWFRGRFSDDASNRGSCISFKRAFWGISTKKLESYEMNTLVKMFFYYFYY